MDADLRRWLGDKVRSARERVSHLYEYICVIWRFVPSVLRRRINVRSRRDLIIRRWTQIYADGFATRFVQSENGCRFYLRTSASSGFVLGTNGSHQCSFAARPDHPQMDA